MFTKIAITPMFVTDQDRALAFYTETLGFEVEADVDFGPMRWVTVHLPGQPDRRIMLQKPGPPVVDPETATQVVALTEKGAGTWTILETDDVHAVFERLRDAGVDITEEPTQQPYGTDMAIRDPFGNQIRITEPPRT